MDGKQASMLLLIMVGAFLMPLLSERIGWFTAPCEMLYGAFIAAVVPGAHDPGSFVSSLAYFGFLLLLFLAGLEIDFTVLLRRGRKGLLRPLIAALGVQIVALGVALALRLPLIDALLLGALSISLLLVVLHEGHLTQSGLGQSLLVIGAFGEFLSIFELTAYDLVSRHGLDWSLLLAAGKLVALLVVGYLVLRALTGAVAHQPHRFHRLFAVRDTTEVGVRAALAFMLVFAAVAVLLDIEQILATFIAGAVCSYAFRGRDVVTRKLTTIGQGFFLPLFFISVGLNLRLGDILHGSSLTLLLTLVLGLGAVRLLVMPLLGLAGVPWRNVLPGALLLSAPLTLIVAISQVGIQLGQLSPSTYGVTLAAAIASGVIFPLLARPLLPKPKVKPAAKPLPQSQPQPQPQPAVRHTAAALEPVPLEPVEPMEPVEPVLAAGGDEYEPEDERLADTVGV
ncbi:MAG TPA: cation:proton antiporter [Ktedonobacterales bacterium]|nr:cation:proton antiporter [Ktedonobacterales bacterium]